MIWRRDQKRWSWEFVIAGRLAVRKRPGKIVALALIESPQQRGGGIMTRFMFLEMSQRCRRVTFFKRPGVNENYLFLPG